MYNINDYVQLKNSNLTGCITRIKRKNNELKYAVNIANKRIWVDENSIEKVVKPTHRNKTEITYNISQNVPNEIMLRHQSVDEALFNLDKFIDSMICQSVKRVRIIHGRHGGILRNAVHEYLNSNKNIVDYHLADYFEGSIGVTIAILK